MTGGCARKGFRPMHGEEPAESVVIGTRRSYRIFPGNHGRLASIRQRRTGISRGNRERPDALRSPACCTWLVTSMTVAMYARRKQWALERVTVRLRHSRVHADDCAACETGETKLTLIERDIEFDGALNEEQRARLLAIANRCPVHLTLTSHIDIRTRLV